MEIANRSEEEFLRVGRASGLRVEDLRGSLPVHATKKWRTRNVNGICGLVYHHAGSDGGFIGISNYHVGPNHISKSGLPSISYSLGVDPSGAVCILNDFKCRTYSHGSKKHPGDENSLYLGVLFQGNLWSPSNPGGYDPTPEQMETARMLADWFKRYWVISGCDIYGHYHFGKAACPGSALEGVIEDLRRDPDAPRLPQWYPRSPNKIRQEALKRMGFYTGVVDGIWGRLSDAALRQFEVQFNLNVNGQWDAVDEVAMFRALQANGLLV